MSLKIVLIVLMLSVLAGFAKAVQDTIAHHHSQSIFAKAGAWWNPAQSWKFKYRNWDAGDKRPAFPMADTWLVSITDAWHFFDLVQRVSLIAAGLIGGIIAGRSRRCRLIVLQMMAGVFIVAATVFHILYTYIFV